MGFIFFPQVKYMFYNEGVRVAGEIIFLAVLYISIVNWGKNMNTFYQLGKNMQFPPLFHLLSIIFSPNMLFGHIFAPNGKIYTPALKWS